MPRQTKKSIFLSSLLSMHTGSKYCDYELANGGGIIFQTFRSGGKGGQHVNKTESAVRAIHISTGLTAIADNERSQYQNKKTARERLGELLRRREEEAVLDEKSALFFNSRKLLRGDPIRIYEGIGFKRVDTGGAK